MYLGNRMDDASVLADSRIVSDPYPIYAQLADKGPVHWCEKLNAWAIVTHADCTNALRDPRLKANRMGAVLSAKFPGRLLPLNSIYHRFTNNVMMYTDDPVHDSLRRSTKAGFTQAAHEHYSNVIERVARNLVDAIPNKSTIDAVEWTAKVPVQAAVHAFGVPEEDLEFVIPRVNVIMTYWSGPQDQPVALDDLLGNLTDLHTYAFELVQGRRGKVLPDTVIARLAGNQDGTECSLEQTIHQLVLLLIALFAPTTPGTLSSGVLSFATNPDQIERFLAEAACANNVANEVARYNASNQFTWRLAADALQIDGVRIEPGQLVVPFLGAANRDARVFDEPNRFDLGRPNSAQHLSFGGGPHSCLGRQIACLEVSWFFTAFLRRFPKVRLAGKPVWNSNLEFRSLRSLPVSLN
jgi:4-nitrotryptophan synthase